MRISSVGRRFNKFWMNAVRRMSPASWRAGWKISRHRWTRPTDRQELFQARTRYVLARGRLLQEPGKCHFHQDCRHCRQKNGQIVKEGHDQSGLELKHAAFRSQGLRFPQGQKSRLPAISSARVVTGMPASMKTCTIRNTHLKLARSASCPRLVIRRSALSHKGSSNSTCCVSGTGLRDTLAGNCISQVFSVARRCPARGLTGFVITCPGVGQAASGLEAPHGTTAWPKLPARTHFYPGTQKDGVKKPALSGGFKGHEDGVRDQRMMDPERPITYVLNQPAGPM